MSTMEVCEPFNESFYNGLVLQGKFIPEELLTEILLRVDRETLLACELVCKRWLFIIQKKNFGRNLIQHKMNFKSVWKLIDTRDNEMTTNIEWKIEVSPINAPPYPKDPRIKQISMCYVPCFINCWKFQSIDLIEEGFTECVLDDIQPTVKVSEWYTCEWGGWASYKCSVKLILEKDGNIEVVQKNFCDELQNNQNKWFRFEHDFKNYGRGLRQIDFYHGGESDSCIVDEATHRCKIAGACVILQFPEKDEIKMEVD